MRNRVKISASRRLLHVIAGNNREKRAILDSLFGISPEQAAKKLKTRIDTMDREHLQKSNPQYAGAYSNRAIDQLMRNTPQNRARREYQQKTQGATAMRTPRAGDAKALLAHQ